MSSIDNTQQIESLLKTSIMSKEIQMFKHRCLKLLVVGVRTEISDVNIRADFVGSFSACYQVGPRGRFSNLRFGATLTFRLTAVTTRKHATKV